MGSVRRQSRALLIGGALFFVSTQSAHASRLGYTFSIYGSRNTPTFRLVNTSDVDLAIRSCELSLRRPNHQFAWARLDQSPTSSLHQAATPVYTTVLPQTLSYEFAGFGAGKDFAFRTNLSSQAGNSVSDYRQILFNNGTGKNAFLTVRYANGQQLSLQLPDTPRDWGYTFSQSTPLDTSLDELVGDDLLPEPSSWLLFLAGAGLVGRLRRNGRRVSDPEAAGRTGNLENG